MDDLHQMLEELEDIREQKRALSERENLLKTMLLAEMQARGIKRITWAQSECPLNCNSSWTFERTRGRTKMENNNLTQQRRET